MPNFILFTSALAMLGLGLGGANAQGYAGYNAADAFGPSERSKGHSAGSNAGLIASGTATGRASSGYPARAQFGIPDRVSRGYSASDDFAVSDD
jgi:hypothetical protein